MKNAIISVLGVLMVLHSGVPQDPPRELRGGGHLLGETAGHFFSEGTVGQLVRACEAADWKSVKQLAKTVDAGSKPKVKDICTYTLQAKQEAVRGVRQEYVGGGDQAMRTDTFTLEGGRVVKIEMVFIAPATNSEGYRPKNFGELFKGLQEAYGEPSKSHTEPVLDVYGAKYDAHRAEWLGKQDVITITEYPGRDGHTEIVVESFAEYNRATNAPKAANPLQ